MDKKEREECVNKLIEMCERVSQAAHEHQAVDTIYEEIGRMEYYLFRLQGAPLHGSLAEWESWEVQHRAAGPDAKDRSV